MKIMEDGVENSPVVVFLAAHKDEVKERTKFEWVKSTENLGLHRIFVQPEMAKWYHNCIDDLVEIIPRMAKGKPVLVVGSSMGGYGALLLAHLLKCDSLSFTPQTNIEKGIDPRWEDITKLIYPMTQHPDWMNLRTFVTGPQHHIYVGNDVDDIKHAAGIKGATLYKVNHDHHNVCGFLKTQGLLIKALMNRIKKWKRRTDGNEHKGN